MSEKNTFKIIRPRNKGNRPAPGSSSQASHSLTPSGTPVPQVHVTGPNISSNHNNTRRDQFSVPERPSYPEPAVAAQPVPSGARRSDPKEPASSTGRRSRETSGKFALNRSKPSTPDLVEQSRPSTPFLRPFTDDTVLPPSPPAPTGNIDGLLEVSGMHAMPSSHHAQLDCEGINVSGLSELANAPSASLESDRKKLIIGAMTLVLQIAAEALRLAPVPGLDAIPNLLLTWLQVYETVGGNDDDLKGLDDDIQRAYVTILQPLELLTDQIPREVVQLIKRFHLALKKQINEIELLKSQNRVKRMFLARELAKRINGVKACINDALNSFATQATTLTLLRTIEASVQSKLEQLPRVAAEHTYVKSKSECLPSTRVQIQTSLVNHLKRAGNRFVWLRGSPGTGKTAVSMSVASMLEKEGTLAASFFWDKNQKGTGLDSLEKFPSTLARQLGIFNGDFKVSLVKCLRQPNSELVLSLPLEDQMRTLILEPMNGLKGILYASEKRFTIVLDGLDECGDSETLGSLMNLVLLLDKLPPVFSILVSSRPEPPVVSAWDESRDESRDRGILCEDMDKVATDETFDTIRLMVMDGLKDCIRKSRWKPSTGDLDVFTLACRGLPVMASIRIREVRSRTQRGSVLKLEFQYFLNLRDAPKDLNEEYLRIMRRAFRPDSSSIPSHVVENYRQVVGMVVAAQSPLRVYSMSHLLGIAEDEIYAILNPISSIIDVPSNNATVEFYHATAKEFITGDPIGEEEDKVFFIDDPKGYFLGLRLLRLVNGVVERNEVGIPTELPLGNRKKWDDFLVERERLPDHIQYSFNRLFEHLDPWSLFSEESNELQREFERLLTQNLLPLLAASKWWMKAAAWDNWHGLDEFSNHRLMKLVKEAVGSILWRSSEFYPWHVYRSFLPFASSSLYELYGHLSDPVQVFSISGEFSGRFIPLSEDVRNAQEVAEAKLSDLPKKFDNYGVQATNYEAEFTEHDVRNGVVTCAAISQDGSHVALGFASGIIEVADINHQRTISRFQSDPPNHPVWIEFILGGNAQIATEDTDGNISVLSHGTCLVPCGALPSGHHPAITVLSSNGCLIVRVPRTLDQNWYRNVALLCVSGEPSIRLLTSPSAPFIPSDPGLSSTPLRHTVGFSPGGRYVGAYDANCAFVWSTDTSELVAQYRVQNPEFWIFNPGYGLPLSYLVPTPVFGDHAVHLTLEEGATHVQSSKPDSTHNVDESWLKRPFYDLSPSMKGNTQAEEHIKAYSSAIGRVPFLSTQSRFLIPPVFFNGQIELIVEPKYDPVYTNTHPSSRENEPWYGDLVYQDQSPYHFPRASKDGTRFLLQGELRTPVVVDISQVVL